MTTRDKYYCAELLNINLINFAKYISFTDKNKISVTLFLFSNKKASEEALIFNLITHQMDDVIRLFHHDLDQLIRYQLGIRLIVQCVLHS